MRFNIKNSNNIPMQSGIYKMYDKENNIIYIGKAKNLRNRVRSYFSYKQNYKTRELIKKIIEIEFILTDNENEAFLLESNMIKKYRPVFNMELKDEQRYMYLRITNEKYPRLIITRRTRAGKFIGKGETHGPFIHGNSKALTAGILRKIFKIRICKKLPKKACLEYHLGNCDAPCEFKNAQKKYDTNISELKLILNQKKKLNEFIKKLKYKMKKSAKEYKYEEAIEIRDTIDIIKNLQIKQKMEDIKEIDEEYFGIKIESDSAYIMTFRNKHGVICDSKKFSFDLVLDNTISNFIYQYYTTHEIPRYIITNININNSKLLESLFSRYKRNTKIILPKYDKQKKLIELIMKNLKYMYLHGIEKGILEINKILNIKSSQVIECFDISNHDDVYAVGAMSRFINGKPELSSYRRFKIKTVHGRNDFAMINEIVKRRYQRIKLEGTSKPNLILIDGGKGQLNAAIKALHYLKLEIPCISLAKKNEEIYMHNSKIIIPKNNHALKILQHVRDEAHRFAIAYNRKIKHSKSYFLNK